jgi:hypothetical protein
VKSGFDGSDGFLSHLRVYFCVRTVGVLLNKDLVIFWGFRVLPSFIRFEDFSFAGFR